MHTPPSIHVLKVYTYKHADMATPEWRNHLLHLAWLITLLKCRQSDLLTYLHTHPPIHVFPVDTSQDKKTYAARCWQTGQYPAHKKQVQWIKLDFVPMGLVCSKAVGGSYLLYCVCTVLCNNTAVFVVNWANWINKWKNGKWKRGCKKKWSSDIFTG